MPGKEGLSILRRACWDMVGNLGHVMGMSHGTKGFRTKAARVTDLKSLAWGAVL